MKSGVSEIVGQAVFQDGTKGTVYKALRQLWCASCSSVVAEGEMFTRDPQQQAGRGLRLWPRCRACRPFALGLDKLDKQTRSALLQNLLTPVEHDKTADEAQSTEAFAATVKRKAKEERQETKDARRKATEEMRRRLGPALERMRRSRNGKL